MILALFIALTVVSMPVVAIVIVTMASRREEADWSLGKPAQGVVQAAARRLLDFHSDSPLPKNGRQARPTAPYSTARGPVTHPRGRTVTDTPRPAATSKVSVGTAA